MPTPATILIPDISGFTDFMTSTEQEHASHLISSFLETIVKNVDSSFEISEIEGDAVLLFKKGKPASKQEILDQCIQIFNAFHTERKMIQQVVLCPCGACQALIDLSLKFVAHFGTLSEIKINKFVKASGVDMIIAHRLLKNNIRGNEYILFTRSLLDQLHDWDVDHGLHWQSITEEFSSIGKIECHYAFLNDKRKAIPDPPNPTLQYEGTENDFIDIIVEASINDVYMTVIDMPSRHNWMHGISEVSMEDGHTFVGSIHFCSYGGCNAKISPAKLELGTEEIMYGERIQINDMNLDTVYEYRFRKLDNRCRLSARFISLDRNITSEINQFLTEDLRISCNNLAVFARNGFKASPTAEQ